MLNFYSWNSLYLNGIVFSWLLHLWGEAHCATGFTQIQHFRGSFFAIRISLVLLSRCFSGGGGDLLGRLMTSLCASDPVKLIPQLLLEFFVFLVVCKGFSHLLFGVPTRPRAPFLARSLDPDPDAEPDVICSTTRMRPVQAGDQRPLRPIEWSGERTFFLL